MPHARSSTSRSWLAACMTHTRVAVEQGPQRAPRRPPAGRPATIVVAQASCTQRQLGEVGALAVELGVERERRRPTPGIDKGVERPLVVDPAVGGVGRAAPLRLQPAGRPGGPPRPTPWCRRPR